MINKFLKGVMMNSSSVAMVGHKVANQDQSMGHQEVLWPSRRDGVAVGLVEQNSVPFPPSKGINSGPEREQNIAQAPKQHHPVGISDLLNPEAGEVSREVSPVQKTKDHAIGILDLLNPEAEQVPNEIFPKQKRAKALPNRNVSNDVSACTSPGSSVLPNKLSTETHALSLEQEWIKTQLQAIEDRLREVYDNDAEYSARCSAFLAECFATNFGQLPDGSLLNKEKENEYRWTIVRKVCSDAIRRLNDKGMIRKCWPVPNYNELACSHFAFIVPFIVPGKIHTDSVSRQEITQLRRFLPTVFREQIAFDDRVKRK